MNIWKKVLAVTVVAVMASAVLYEGMYGTPTENPGQIPGNALVHKKTVNIWYTDEALSDFLASAALDFSESRNVRVIPRLVSGLEYLETINQESRTSNSIPDLYIVGNESLEKAYLSGLACEVWDDGFVSEENFPESALRAVTYIDKIVAYPFYYETSALIYNKTYMEEHARTILEAEADAIAGEEAMAELEDDGEAETETETASVMYQEEEISERMDTLIPSSMEDILSFADTYEAPEQVEAVFKWDVSDIFYNYFFVGNYVNVGGPDGDDTEQIDIYNLDAIRCLQSYHQLNQFFSIEAD